jgi:hypothetical protein
MTPVLTPFELLSDVERVQLEAALDRINRTLDAATSVKLRAMAAELVRAADRLDWLAAGVRT